MSEDSTTPSLPSPGFHPVVLSGLLASAVLTARLPLWLLPGPGRDEAAYHYWAHHPEPVYSLLVQWSVRLSELLGGHTLLALRAPVILLGILVLWLNDQRLSRAGAHTTWRWLAAFALACCPWQNFAGSILHPDDFMLAALLVMVLAVQRQKLWWAVGAAVAAVAAKPTGIIFLPVMWWLIDNMKDASRIQRWAGRAVLAAIAVAVAATIKPDMIAGMADFGRMSNVPWYTRSAAGVLSLVFLGGPVLLVIAGQGARQRWQERDRPENRASLALAAMLLAVFLTAAVTHGQFKGNWVLPAVVLLWPARSPDWFSRRWARVLMTVALGLVCVGSAAQALVLTHPATLDRIEQSLIARNAVPRWAAYTTQAGVREKSVSSSRSWSNHVCEYADESAFANQVKAEWCEVQGAGATIPWIIASDYGLACQLHWYLGEPAAKVAVYGDGIFHRTWQVLAQEAPTVPMLALAVPRSHDLVVLRTLPPVPHPVNGLTLRPRIVRWRSSNQETNHVKSH